jgi:hypothetical protein
MANLTAADIVAFAAREGNKMIEAQVNMKARLFAALDKQQMKGKRSVINVIDGGLSSTSQVLDYGALPAEAANVPAQGFVDAVGYVSRLGLGRIALETLAGVDDSADLLDLQLQIAADDMARQVGRAVYGSKLQSPSVAGTVTQAGGAGTQVEVKANFTGGLSDFREGEAYHLEPNATHNFLVRCVNVSFVSDNAVEVTFVAGPGSVTYPETVPGFDSGAYANALLAETTATLSTGVEFFLRGSRVVGDATNGNVSVAASGASAVSLQDITDTSSTLHGLPANSRGWTGITFAVGGSPTPEVFLGKSKLLQARSGVAPTHLVLSPLASAAYGAAQLTSGQIGFGSTAESQPRRSVDGKLDKYGKDADMESGLAMFGRPVLIDDNCPVQTAYLVNKDYLKVGEWKKISAEDEGGSPLLLSRSTFSKEVQFSCIYNLVCRKRNAHAALTGITVA